MKTKHILGVAALALSSLTLAGCSGFLSPEPESTYTTNTFYSSQNDFDKAITAAYAVMEDCYKGDKGYLHFLTARSDETNSINTNLYSDGAESFTDNSSCSPTEKLWNYMYQMISRTNSILVHIDNVKFSNETLKNSIKGEAYGLRAWAYETMGKMFGGVPLLVDKEYTVAETHQVARSTQKETLEQAVKDYKNAISLLPSSWDSADRGRMTKWAANAALGRLLMFMNQPAEARPYLEAVIGSGLYQMAANYEGIFSDAYDNDPQNDRLWEVQYVGGQSTEGQDYSEMMMMEDCGIDRGWAYRGASSAMQVSTDLLSTFESGDGRQAWFTVDDLTDSKARGYTWCTKFCRARKWVPTSGSDWAVNLPVIRYTEVLMLEAEAINATDGPTATAIGYVNQVRQRAGLPALASGKTDTQAHFLEAIKQERRIEFMWEGLRWFDLIRWGDMVSTYQKFFAQSDEGNGQYVKQVDNNRAIFAIPQTEMDIYDNTSILWQNDGY